MFKPQTSSAHPLPDPQISETGKASAGTHEFKCKGLAQAFTTMHAEANSALKTAPTPPRARDPDAPPAATRDHLVLCSVL